MANTTEIKTYTATVRAERTRRRKEGDRVIRTVEQVEAQVELTLNLHDIAWDLGSAAIQSANGKAGKMMGAVKAKILSETVVDKRETVY